MSKTEEAILQEYRQHVASLYDSVRAWAQKASLSIDEREIELFEEAAGKYMLTALILRDEKSRQLAEIRPIAAWVLAAKGRVDLIGQFAQEILVYLEQGGPVITIARNPGNGGEQTTRPLYKGIAQAGWYWMENTRLKKAHALNQEVFFDLLAEVSDYEFPA